MEKEIIIEPMTEDFILWRCLHGGPLSKQTIEQTEKWSKYRQTSLSILKKLIETYGTCAMVARQGDEVIGVLRFYPKAIMSMEKAGYMCLQQDYPAGPAEDFIDEQLPSLDQIEDKTLKIHCIMTSRPYAGDKSADIFGVHIRSKQDVSARKGLGLKLAEALKVWAKDNGWKKLEVTTFADLDIFYGLSGSAGKTFWLKVGFELQKTRPMSRDDWPDEKAQKLIDSQAEEAGINPERAWVFYDMTFDL